jgi:surface polysaccharide O-acyltransferase-like enzyme
MATGADLTDGDAPGRSRRPQARMDWLDALRGLAIVLVVLAHAHTTAILDGSASATSAAWLVAWFCLPFAKLGVPLFTVLSGYLVLSPRPGETLTAFYIKRARRILPPLLIWHVIYAMLVSGSPFRNPYGLMHLWFLWALIPLYAVTPLLRRLAGRTTPPVLLALSLAALGASILTGLHAGNLREVLGQVPHSLSVAALRLLPFYLLGGALRGLGRLKGTTTTVIALAGPVLRASRYGFWHAAMASGLVLWLKGREGRAVRFAAAVGRKSFGIYLAHAVFQLWLVQPLWAGRPLPCYSIPTETAVVVALSWWACWAYDATRGIARRAATRRRTTCPPPTDT